FRWQTPDDVAVVNEDDPPAREMAASAKARHVAYGLTLAGDGFTVANDAIVERRGRDVTTLVPVSAVKVPGRHILSDVVAATAISRTAGATGEAMTQAVSAFPGLEHAMEVVATVGGVRYAKNSKTTTVESARRSIESVGRGVFAIVGGRYKGGDFADLVPALVER